MIIFGGLKEQSDNQEPSSKQRECVSQMTKNIFDRLMGDDHIEEADGSLSSSADRYEFIIKDFYDEIYSRDEEEFSFDTFDLDNSELNISLLPFEKGKWELLDNDGKQSAIQNYGEQLAKSLELNNPPKIYFFQGLPRECGAYDRRNHVIRVNENNLDDSVLIVNTVAHETWHAYQYQCAENPKTKKDMLYVINFRKYVSPIEYDGKWILFDEYEGQLVEAEARSFGNVLADKVGGQE